MISVLLVDDHEIVRRGIRELLESEDDITVVHQAGTMSEALALDLSQVSVAILDIRLPDGSGIEICRFLQEQSPKIPCVMLTSFDDDEALFASVVAGASGYLLKEIHSDELLSAVRMVASGQMILDPEVVALGRERMKKRALQQDRIEKLSPQELRILEHLVDGLTNRAIGDAMFLSEKTVKNYVSSLLLKLGFARRTEAAVFGATTGLKRTPRLNSSSK
jgi:DNA-binding NarL/FixJ family response regulator